MGRRHEGENKIKTAPTNGCEVREKSYEESELNGVTQVRWAGSGGRCARIGRHRPAGGTPPSPLRPYPAATGYRPPTTRRAMPVS